MPKVRINWLFRDGRYWIRGYDIIETEIKDFDEEDATRMMDDEMWGTGLLSDSKMPNFRKNACADSPQTWRVLSIKLIDNSRKAKNGR